MRFASRPTGWKPVKSWPQAGPHEILYTISDGCQESRRLHSRETGHVFLQAVPGRQSPTAQLNKKRPISTLIGRLGIGGVDL